MSEQIAESRGVIDHIADTADRLDIVVPKVIASAAGITALSGIGAEVAGQLGRGMVIGACSVVMAKIVHRDWVEASPPTAD